MGPFCYDETEYQPSDGERREAAGLSWPAYGRGRGPSYVEPTPEDLERARRAGQRAIRQYEEEHGQPGVTISRRAPSSPLPGWNFGGGNRGVIE